MRAWTHLKGHKINLRDCETINRKGGISATQNYAFFLRQGVILGFTSQKTAVVEYNTKTTLERIKQRRKQIDE